MHKTNTPPTLIVPGLAGSPEGHWQHIWAEERENARFVVQDSWDTPDLDRWKARLEQALSEASDAFLVAHSLGCVLVAHLAESPLANRIRGALLVAPCDLEATEVIHPRLIRFGAMPESRLPFPAVLIGSRNDPYMAEERARGFATLWGARFVDMGYVGHINRASGFGRFARGYQLFDTLLAGQASAALPAGHASPQALDPQQLVKLRPAALAQF